ncbi:hypothetical protein ACHAXT_002268 [Thalassiosira profunda]
MEQQESVSAAALVRDPRSADVLAGLELPHSHPGNVTFMQLARMCSAEYRVANYSQQPVIIANIVTSIKQGGRFLRRDPRSGMWEEMDDGLACAMTEEALRVCREMDEVGAAASNQQQDAGLAQNHAHHVHQNSISAATAAAAGLEEPRQLLLQHMMANQQIGSFDQRGMNSQQHLSGSVVTCQPTMPHPSHGTDDRMNQHSSGMLAGLSSIESSVAPPPKSEAQLMGAIRGELARQRQVSLLRSASLAADDALHGGSAHLSKAPRLGDDPGDGFGKMVLENVGMHAKRPTEMPKSDNGAKHSIPSEELALEPTLKSIEERAVSQDGNPARDNESDGGRQKMAYDELDELGSKSLGPEEQDLKEDDSSKPASDGVVVDELKKPESDTVGSNQKGGEAKAPSGIDETSVEEDRDNKEDEANLKRQSQAEVEAESTNTETGTGGSEQKPSHAVSVTPPMPLAAASDVNILSPILSYIRKHCVVVFEATSNDGGGPRCGRQAAVKEGCVGIRCAFCGHLERSQRASQATSFPSSIAKLRTAATMIQSRHFPNCTEMPTSVREDLARLKKKTGKENGNSTAADCKNHWIDSAKELGLVDTRGGIRFSRSAQPVAEPEEKPVETDDAKKGTESAEEAGVTFYCPKCQKHVHFSSARTASESFGCHVRACGKGKRPKKTSVNTAPAKKRRSARIKSESTPSEEATVAGGVVSDQVEKPRKRATRMAEALPVADGRHFSKEEDLRLYEGFKEFGPQWKKISELYFDGARKNEDLRVRRRTNEYKERTGDEGLPQPGRRGKGPPGIPGQSRKKRQDARVKEAKETPNDTSVLEEDDDASSSKKGKTELYPHAPMGHLWLDKALSASNAGASADGGLLVGRCWAWDEGYYVDDQFDPKAQTRERKLESSLLKGGCACEATRLSAPVDSIGPKAKSDDDKSQSGRARRTQRSASSAIDIADELARGALDPHTLIACDEYEMGPESRFAEGGQPGKAQPFIVRVNPDANFLADLHAHLCSSEIIGLLGGRYVEEEKCIYIQAAFPCKATDRLDSGSTDVEMDPIGQIYATEAIATQGLSVVGWYHSHPDFQPTPSVVDVENQASYQQLFQGDGDSGSVPPFVGLIVGTYDSKNPSSHSVMRWFHVQPKPTSDTQVVNYPMNVITTNRHYRKMMFDDESTEEGVRRSMTQHGTQIRRALESRKFSCAVPGSGSFKQTDPGARSGSGPDPASKPRHVAETGESPLLLSDALFEQRKEIWQFPAAYPLFFTEAERAVLEIDDRTVPYDVFAGIIWFAVEREQQMLPKVALEEASMPSPRVSASSRSILELLLRQSLTSTALHQRLYKLIHCLEAEQPESATQSEEPLVEHTDAAVFHNVDALLSHYAPKLNKINPFATWSGAGDKGKELNGSTSEPWAEYYLTNVLRMKPVDTEGRVLKGGSKIKRGHKIGSSLLKWARNMQLGSSRRDTFAFANSDGNGMVFDHEQTLCDEALAGGSSAGHEASGCSLEGKRRKSQWPKRASETRATSKETVELCLKQQRQDLGKKDEDGKLAR